MKRVFHGRIKSPVFLRAMLCLACARYHNMHAHNILHVVRVFCVRACVLYIWIVRVKHVLCMLCAYCEHILYIWIVCTYGIYELCAHIVYTNCVHIFVYMNCVHIFVYIAHTIYNMCIPYVHAINKLFYAHDSKCSVFYEKSPTIYEKSPGCKRALHFMGRARSCITHTTGWPRLIECLTLQGIFRKRATNYRALLRKMTSKDKASYGSSPPSVCVVHNWKRAVFCEKCSVLHAKRVCMCVCVCVCVCERERERDHWQPRGTSPTMRQEHLILW